jgi:hypothetical protein
MVLQVATRPGGTRCVQHPSALSHLSRPSAFIAVRYSSHPALPVGGTKDPMQTVLSAASMAPTAIDPSMSDLRLEVAQFVADQGTRPEQRLAVSVEFARCMTQQLQQAMQLWQAIERELQLRIIAGEPVVVA